MSFRNAQLIKYANIFLFWKHLLNLDIRWGYIKYTVVFCIQFQKRKTWIQEVSYIEWYNSNYGNTIIERHNNLSTRAQYFLMMKNGINLIE